MPSSEEVRMLEGVSVAQHRFRLVVKDPTTPDLSLEGGPHSGTVMTNAPRLAPDVAVNGPFIVCIQHILLCLSQVFNQMPYRNSRYKDKFLMLREKYERITAKQDEYHRDLDLAMSKIKKLQAENDMLLDALSAAAAQVPVPFGISPHRDRPAHDAPPGPGPMDALAAPLLPEQPPHHVNGNGVNSGDGLHSASSNSSLGAVSTQVNGMHAESRLSRPPSIEFISHDMNGRPS
ncbi:hypothetical protein GGX14DRAFT_583890 [Mycena pura]|uniref:Uncharacterized protein n=1 Tax=Mycena pura TaxID=153505 RepID=A0AAD7E616_9AGAR|nr:hypothetical protein GGX14DRAFT_583890 [Mycena pura]